MLHNTIGLSRLCNANDLFFSGNGLQCGNCLAFSRKLNNLELADLSSNWENSTVDTNKYYQNVLCAYEVDEKSYNHHKSNGGLCQKNKNNFYVA